MRFWSRLKLAWRDLWIGPPAAVIEQCRDAYREGYLTGLVAGAPSIPVPPQPSAGDDEEARARH